MPQMFFFWLWVIIIFCRCSSRGFFSRIADFERKAAGGALAGPGGVGVAREPRRQRRRARTGRRNGLCRRGPAPPGVLAQRRLGLVRCAARSPCGAGDPPHAREAGPSVDDRRTGARGRAVAFGPARTIRRTRRPATDAIPHQLAHAAGRRPAAQQRHQGCNDRAGGGLRLRGRLLPRVQTQRGPPAGGVAAQAARGCLRRRGFIRPGSRPSGRSAPVCRASPVRRSPAAGSAWFRGSRAHRPAAAATRVR